MEQPIEEMTRVDHRKLTRFVTAAFEKLGVPPGDAAIAAQALGAAALGGGDTHGPTHLPHDVIGTAMTSASRQVGPPLGRAAKYGTNPMCFAVPADKQQPFVLDMATTTAAAGKLELAVRLGKSIPGGWALG